MKFIQHSSSRFKSDAAAGQEGENKVCNGEGCLLISLQVHTYVTNQRYFELARRSRFIFIKRQGTRREEVGRLESLTGSFHKSLPPDFIFFPASIRVSSYRVVNSQDFAYHAFLLDFKIEISMSIFTRKPPLQAGD